VKHVLHGLDENADRRATSLLPGMQRENRSRDLSQWYTPSKLAARVVEWARVHNRDVVCEPSAGRGALVKPLLERGCHVDAWEIDPGNAAALGELAHAELTVYEADFLASPGWDCSFRYDLALMNPPYEGNQDVCFIALAASRSERIVGLFQSRIVHSKGRAHFWRWHNIDRLAILSERPRFGGEHSAKTDFIVSEITRRAAPRKQGEATPSHVEWW
jgi:predicted RNA methylase